MPTVDSYEHHPGKESNNLSDEAAQKYCIERHNHKQTKYDAWIPRNHGIDNNIKEPKCPDAADLKRPARENSKIFYPDRMSFGGKKLRRKTYKKSHRKSSKKQRKSRRGGKSRRGRR